jgi:hypothetical protein
MPTVQITITIQVHNYSEIVTNQKGSFWGACTSIPLLGSLIKYFVDRRIEKEVREKVIALMPSQLETRLLDRGVRATVHIS